MTKVLHLKVVTPERTLFEEDALEISLPTQVGRITILPEHAKLVTKVEQGDMIVKTANGEKIAVIFGGIAMVEVNNNVTILADSADHIEEINEKEVEEAIKKAREYTQRFTLEKTKSPETMNEESQRVLAETQAELLRNLTRLKVVRKHRSHGIKYPE